MKIKQYTMVEMKCKCGFIYYCDHGLARAGFIPPHDHKKGVKNGRTK